MASKVDMSLDEIIVKTKVNKRGGRGLSRGTRGQNRGNRGSARPNRGIAKTNGAAARPIAGRGRSAGRGGQRGVSRPARANFRSPRGNVNGNWSQNTYYGAASLVRTASSGPTKLNISNLDYRVSDSDIKELFTEFGNMRTAAIHYDRFGKSLGTAHVLFERRPDAIKAIKQYNGVHLDGRPMKIAIDGESASASLNGAGTFRLTGAPSNVKRLQAGPKPLMGNQRGMQARRGRGAAGRRGGSSARGGTSVRGAAGVRRGGTSARGSAGTRRGGTGSARGGASNRRGRGGKPKTPTAAELDAELDSYRFQT